MGRTRARCVRRLKLYYYDVITKKIDALLCDALLYHHYVNIYIYTCVKVDINMEVPNLYPTS